MNKEDYIKLLRKLLKKYHPDLCNDKNLIKEYTEITKKLNMIRDKLLKSHDIRKSDNTNSTRSKDKIEDDYYYYQLGIKFYKKIHPGIFYSSDSKGNMESKSCEEQKKILDSLYLIFGLSKNYFQKIIDCFPHSVWLADSKSKIKLLDELEIRYSHFALFSNNNPKSHMQFMGEHGLNLL